MTRPRPWPSKALTPLVAIAAVVVLYGLARLPALSPSESEAAAARFRFARLPLPEVLGVPHKQVRAVHPSLERISGWISSLGAACALADLDGDGLPNDLCHVDPRTDQVIVAPAPGTGDRYAPFCLDPAPLAHNPATMAPMGTLVGDFNEDGLADVLVYYWGRPPVLFLRRADRPGPPAAAQFVPASLAPVEERWYTNAATQADLDGDGHLDLIIANYFPDGARILDAHATGVEQMHQGKAKALNGGHKHLFLWKSAKRGAEPAVTFEEQHDVFDEVVDRGWTLAVGAADLDGDLLPEIYFAHDFGPDRLLHNRSTPGKLRFAVLEGKRTLTTPASCVLGFDSFKGMGVDFADLNGDGVPDIYVSNIATEFGLEESHFLWLSTGDTAAMKDGVAPYVQASEALGLSRSGWGWDCRLADFDNDGVPEAVQATGFLKGTVNRWPELQALGTANSRLLSDPRYWPRFQPGDDLSGGNVNPFFVKGQDGRYHDLAARLGMTEPMVSRGIAVADVDGDGRLDFALANQWGPSFLHRNEAPAPGAFLGLHLVVPVDGQGRGKPVVHAGHPSGAERSWPAVGASAVVRLADGRRLAGQVDGGSGHSGKRSPDLHFGLGEAAGEVEVLLRWRSPEGRVREQTLRLAPGWHTVRLD